jgi:hypothetical protein
MGVEEEGGKRGHSENMSINNLITAKSDITCFQSNWDQLYNFPMIS